MFIAYLYQAKARSDDYSGKAFQFACAPSWPVYDSESFWIVPDTVSPADD